jgi:hypothetical protein
MERFNALGRGMQIMLVASVLLLIDSFFRWQEVEFDLGPLGGGSAGVTAWDNFLGIVMGLLTIVLIAWIVARIARVEIPIPVSPAMTGAVLAVLIFALALLKNLTDDFSTFWSYLGVVLAALIAVGAWLVVQEAGGVEHLKSQMPSSGRAAAPAAEASAPAPPAAAEPAPPAMAEPPMTEEAAPEASSDEPSTERET